MKLYRRVRASKVDGRWQDDPNGGWRYIPVKEGRGQKTGDLEPPFYVHPTVITNGVQSRPWMKLDATTVSEAKKETETLTTALTARAQGLTVAELDTATNVNRTTIRAAVDKYLDQKKSKSTKTVQQYRLVLNDFIESIRVRFMDEITMDVLRRYKRAMEEEGFAGKTIDTRLNIVFFLLKKNGITVRLPKDEMPTVEEEPAVPYSEEELKKLFAAMTPEEVVRYKFFLGTACRDREVTFAAWSDVNFERKTFTVRSKPDAGFTVKNHESRTMRIPTSLVELLKARRKNAPHDRWIFVNEDGRPDNHFLRKLKRIALRAGMNCGQCRTTVTKGKYDRKHEVEVTCKTDPVCEHIYLHRLRKTCATRWQEHGVPVRTIQAWLGHKNLETTMIYLGVTDTAKLGNEVDKAFGD